jgi:hypothetical protein
MLVVEAVVLMVELHLLEVLEVAVQVVVLLEVLLQVQQTQAVAVEVLGKIVLLVLQVALVL